MQAGQDWCLQCGTGAPGSLAGGPGWRAVAAVLGTTALLVGGASVAAYAALNENERKALPAATVAKVGAPAPTATPTPGATTPGTTPTPGTPGTPTTIKGAPPKIPLQTPTPKASGGASGPNHEANNALFPPETKSTATSTPKSSSGSTQTSTSGSKAQENEAGSGDKGASGSEPPSPILLDTNAASVYDPYAYPPTLFGDPSLAIDGEAKTAWTAQVQPAAAPRMAEGLQLDLKTPQKLGSVAVKTGTVGITVEVYGSNARTPPTSISDPQWVRIVGLKVLKKADTTLRLKTPAKYRYVVLWLVKAPATSTPTSPGAVAIDEFELFRPA
jgi:hypothetical protein